MSVAIVNKNKQPTKILKLNFFDVSIRDCAVLTQQKFLDVAYTFLSTYSWLFYSTSNATQLATSKSTAGEFLYINSFLL